MIENCSCRDYRLVSDRNYIIVYDVCRCRNPVRVNKVLETSCIPLDQRYTQAHVKRNELPNPLCRRNTYLQTHRLYSR